MSRELIIFDRPSKKVLPTGKRVASPASLMDEELEEEASLQVKPVRSARTQASSVAPAAAAPTAPAPAAPLIVAPPAWTDTDADEAEREPVAAPIQRHRTSVPVARHAARVAPPEPVAAPVIEEAIAEEPLPEPPARVRPKARPAARVRRDQVAIPDLDHPVPERAPLSRVASLDEEIPEEAEETAPRQAAGRSWLPFGGKKKAARARTAGSETFEEDVATAKGEVDTEALYSRGLATIKDLIAPPAIKVTANSMAIGDVVSRTLFVIAYPRYLSTNWFSPIVNLDFPMDTALFIHPIETGEILKQLRKSATQVQSQMNIEVEEGKIRDPVLESALQNIEELRDRLQQGTEKFFRFGLYLTIYGSDEKNLTERAQAIESMLEAQLVYTKTAILRMDKGFAATRPLGSDVLDVANNLNTEPLSTTFPFVSSDLSSNEGILYGINRHNNSLILFDRFKMENANMVVFAKSGAGKSYTVKLEVLRSLMFGSDVIIIDPENEYKHLCETVGGSFVPISLNSAVHLNPFDLPKVQEGESAEGVFRNAVANLVGLFHLMLGSLTPEEDSILDHAISTRRPISPSSMLRPSPRCRISTPPCATWRERSPWPPGSSAIPRVSSPASSIIRPISRPRTSSLSSISATSRKSSGRSPCIWYSSTSGTKCGPR